MAGRLLVVCSQNVCRSPYVALSLAASRGPEDDGDDGAGGLIIASRGITASSGEAMCGLAAERFPPEQVGAHQARALTASDLQRADLVLTMSAVERGAAALLHPPARSRTFTVREALVLAAGAPLPGLDAGQETLQRLAATLNERRGLQALPARSRPSLLRRWRRLGTEPEDVRDRHREGERSHRKLFPELDELVGGLLTLMPHAPRAIPEPTEA